MKFNSKMLIKNSNRNQNQQPIIKQPSRMTLHDLGIPDNNTKILQTVEEIRENPPNIVVAECVKDFVFTQNKFKNQRCTKRVKYCMGMGVFSQLHEAEMYDYKKGKKCKVKIFKASDCFKFKKNYRPYSGQDLTDKRLLVWRTGGFGDLLFIQPSLRYLKKLYPTCKIMFSCAAQYKSMVESFKEVDQLIPLPFNADLLFETNSEYHAIFEGVIERTREAQKENAFVLFSKSIGLDIPLEDLVPQIDPKIEKMKAASKVLDEWGILGSKFVVLQPRTSSIIRTPRPSIMTSIINHLIDLGLNIVITDSPSQFDFVESIISNTKDKSKVYNFTKKSDSMDMTIGLTSMCELVVAPDSAMIHIGAALNKKVFGIYGAFPGNIRMSTYKNCDWIEPKKEKNPCSPCFLHGNEPCRHSIGGYSPCFDMINLGDVFQKIDKLLSL